MFSVKQAYIPQRENWNKTNALINVTKKKTTPRKWWFKSNQSWESTYLPLFALLVTHEEKCQSRMPVSLKKTKFAPASVQAGSSSRTFHPEATGAGGKKTIPLETQTPTFTALLIFLCQTPSLYPDYIFLLFVLEPSILFHFCKQFNIVHVH